MEPTLPEPLTEERTTEERRLAPVRLQPPPPIDREEVCIELEEEDGADRDRR